MASAASQHGANMAEPLKTLAAVEQALITAATEGASTLADDASHGARQVELSCPQCRGVLYKPTTLMCGTTLCTPCVPKWKSPPGATFTTGVGAGLGYGQSTNTVLTNILGMCMPLASKAAGVRQEGNALFRAGKREEAAAVYSTAIDLCAQDATLFSNRAACRLHLGDAQAALQDAEQAVALEPSWAKASFRRGAALLKLGAGRRDYAHTAKAAGSFACAVALDVQASEGGRGGVTAAAARKQLRAALEALEALEASATPAGLADGSGDTHEGVTEASGGPGNSAELRSTLEGLATGEFVLAVVREAEDEGRLPSRAIPDERLADIAKDLECIICYNVVFKPATLPCGHVLCRPCLARALDHAFDKQPECPMCRHGLSDLLRALNLKARDLTSAGNRYSHGGQMIQVTADLDRLLTKRFSSQYIERANDAAREEASEHNQQIPLFICSLALPGQECPLHIFEPRYRLMMRRCMESGHARFGMCLSPDSDYGTLLNIVHFEQLPDGRSLVKTVGADARFHITARSVRDGYTVGTVEWVTDAAEDSDAEVKETAALEASVRGDLEAARPALVLLTAQHGQGQEVPDVPSKGYLLPFYAIEHCMRGVEAGYECAFGEATRSSHLARLRAVQPHVATMKRAIQRMVGGDSYS